MIFLPISGLAFLTEFLTQPEALFSDRFWRSVLVDMVPAILVVGLVWWLSARFGQAVYGLESIDQALAWMRRHQFGQIGFSPFVLLRGGKVNLDLHQISSVGGPAGLVIHNDTAVVLEKRGWLTRVAGPGLQSLEPFENIYDVVDLRPKHWRCPVGAITKEGVPITWEVEVQYQIDDGGQKPTDKVPYPFSEQAVFRASTGKWRRESGRVQELDWEGWVVVSQTQGTLRSILARHYLDELIGLSKSDRLAARQSVQAELAQTLGQAAPERGVKILEVKLGQLKVEDEVTQQLVENWLTHWHYWSTNQLAKEEAGRIESYETAKADAQILPLNLFTQEIQKLKSTQDVNFVVLLRLISALTRAPFENELFAPNEALETLQKFIKILSSDEAPPAENGSYRSPQAGNGTPSSSPSPGSPAPLSTAQKVLPLRVLPLISEIAAGREIPASDDIIGEVRQMSEKSFVLDDQLLRIHSLYKGRRLKFLKEYNYFVVQVSGDSMDEAGILPGDYVILQKPNRVSLQPTPGEIVAVVFRDEDDKATLKRFLIGLNEVVLRPESSNPEHKLRSLPLSRFTSDESDVEVVGLAMAVLKPESPKDRPDDQPPV